MRKVSVMLGLAGGAVGIAMHAYLLAGLLNQTAPASAEIKRLVIGITLGAAGLAAGLAVRASRLVSMPYLLSLGLLGFFPNPSTWAPAGALLIIAGALALLDLRRATVAPAPRTVAQPAVQPAAPKVTIAGPDGAPLHWSLVPRYLRGGGLIQAREASASASAFPVLAAPDPLASCAASPGPAAPCPAEAGARAGWNPRSKLLVTVTVVAIAALVVPFSLWPQESLAAAPESPTKAAVNMSAAPGPAAPSGAAPVTASESASATTTSTTVVSALTRVGSVDPGDPDAFVFYSDVRFGLTVSVPSDWAEVPASGLADYRAQAYHVAAFAEVRGATLQAAYLNGLTIEVLAGSQTEDPPQELVRQSLQAFVDSGPGSYDYFKVLEPIQEATVGSTPALVTTVRITWNKRVMVKSVYTFIANHCLYRVDLQTDDVDWNDHEDLFEQVLDSVSFASGSAVPALQE